MIYAYYKELTHMYLDNIHVSCIIIIIHTFTHVSVHT